jgi:hypothetical protein
MFLMLSFQLIYYSFQKETPNETVFGLCSAVFPVTTMMTGLKKFCLLVTFHVLMAKSMNMTALHETALCNQVDTG